MQKSLPRLIALSLLAFRVLSFGLMVLSALAAMAFISMAAIQIARPGVLLDSSIFINLFIGSMGALMCYVGWRGIKLRSPPDLDGDIAKTKLDLERLER